MHLMLGAQVAANSRAVRPLYLMAMLGADRSAPIVGRTRLVKLVFLMQKKVLEELRLGLTADGYRFRAFNFGPFTEEVYDDFETLRIRGLAGVEGADEALQSYHLTDAGVALLSRLLSQGRLSRPLFDEIQKVKVTYGRLALDKLIRQVYAQYPSYTGESLIRDRFT